MVLAIPGEGKLGHADLINSPAEGYPFGWNHTTPSRGKVFPDLPGKSVHHSTDEPELYGIEKQRVSNEGPHPGVHAVTT